MQTEYTNPYAGRHKPLSNSKGAVLQSSFQKAYKDQYNNDSKPPGTTLPSEAPVPKKQVKEAQSNHIKVSIRLPKGPVTSFTIKKNIIALWLLYTADPNILDVELLCTLEKEEDIKAAKDKISTLFTDFVYKCLDSWDSKTGKGLSEFITNLMLQDMLDEGDYEVLKDIFPFI